jgi:hypothetical protein
MRLADGSFYHGWARWCAGDGDGEAAMREGLVLWNEMHYRLFAPLTGTLLAECEAEAGRAEVGLATLDAQLAAIELTGSLVYAEVHRARGELLILLRERTSAAGGILLETDIAETWAGIAQISPASRRRT